MAFQVDIWEMNDMELVRVDGDICFAHSSLGQILVPLLGEDGIRNTNTTILHCIILVRDEFY